MGFFCLLGGIGHLLLHGSLESKMTPSAFMDYCDKIIVLLSMILIGSVSFLWKRHSSVLFAFIFKPESVSHFEINFSLDSSSFLTWIFDLPEAKEKFSSAKL